MKSRLEAHEQYRKIFAQASTEEWAGICRYLATNDLFFLLYNILNRKDIDHDWLYARCHEVQKSPDGHLDLWFRDGYKSTIITFGKTIQDILKNPNITIGIFSCTRPIAKAFLRQIKLEFEGNSKLKTLFPDILYENPKKDAPKWSEDDGLIVRRSANPKEATLEAHGLVDSMPTSKHFQLMVYDDVVTREYVATPEMIQKTNAAWELSRNLSTVGGRVRYIGTRYHFNDTYALMMERKAARPRVYPATDNGQPSGNPVFWTREVLEKKMIEMGTATAAAQLFQDPRVQTLSGFCLDDFRYWSTGNLNNLNLYILGDPANDKKKRSDYTVFVVVGLGSDENYMVVDIIRDRLGPTERSNVLFKLHRDYRPIAVGYEHYGMQSDIQTFKDRMERENYRFSITPLGGSMSKRDRITNWLLPLVEAHRIYLPDRCIHVDYMGKQVDNTRIFLNEEVYPYPFPTHDDILDCLSRIQDPDFPMAAPMDDYIAGRGRQSIADNIYDPLESRYLH